MQTTRIAIVLGLWLVALSGCRDSTDPRPVIELRPGVMSIGAPPWINVPAEGAVGAPVVITVVTFGGGCVREGATESSVNGLEADVTPYDSVYVSLPPNMACTADLRLYTHTATVTFATAGAAVVRVHGWSDPDKALIVVERAIQIR